VTCVTTARVTCGTRGTHSLVKVLEKFLESMDSNLVTSMGAKTWRRSGYQPAYRVVLNYIWFHFYLSCVECNMVETKGWG
jgi:hypothetical protein